MGLPSGSRPITPPTSDKTPEQSPRSWRSLSLQAYKTLAKNMPSLQKYKETRAERTEEDKRRKWGEKLARRDRDRNAESVARARERSMVYKVRKAMLDRFCLGERTANPEDRVDHWQKALDRLEGRTPGFEDFMAESDDPNWWKLLREEVFGKD